MLPKIAEFSLFSSTFMLQALQETMVYKLLSGGGDLVERWVRGCVAENGSLFCPSCFAIAPVFLKSGFNFRVPLSFSPLV